jgi:hypothetical protein
MCATRGDVSNDERLLWIYFHAIFLVLIIAHTLELNERAVALKLTVILEYFANVLGQRLNTIRFGDITVL